MYLNYDIIVIWYASNRLLMSITVLHQFIIIIIIFIIITIIIISFFLVPSVVKIPRVKNIKLKSDLEWLTFGIIPIDQGASESNLIEALY